jgi:3-oxoadipate enol-lactonase
MEHVTGHADVEGARLYYERAGSGVPVVLLHTGNGDATMWDGQFESLAAEYQVIRYDMRGFGRSDYPPAPFLFARDLAGLLAHLRVDQAHVVGPSLGGRIAVDFALLYPAMTRSLVLAAPVIREHDWSEEITADRIAEDEAFRAGDFETATLAMMRSWVFGPSRGGEDMDPGLLDRIRRTQRASYLIRQQAIRDTGTEPDEEELTPPAGDRLSGIAAPTLVLIGALDAPDPIAIGERLARTIPGARRQVVDGVGHMISMERPDEFLKTVRAFLRETDEARA